MRRICLAVIGLGALATSSSANAGTYSVLYQFGSDQSHTLNPLSLVALPSGSLVGLASVQGTPSASETNVIFELDPPATGKTAWAYSVIYDMRDFPLSDQLFVNNTTFLIDAAGQIYGGTEPDGTVPDSGTIYRLSPPVTGKGAWTCTLLYHHYSPSSTDMYPELLVNLDHDLRHLYGYGYFFQPVAGGFPNYVNESIFRLDLPDPGTPTNRGALTPLTPPIFSNMDGSTVALVAARNGTFYGASTTGFGSDFFGVFDFVPAKPGQSQGRLGRLADGLPNHDQPSTTITVDNAYNITGVGMVENSFGEVWRVSPPSVAGGAWRSSVLYSFKGSPGQDGSNPQQIINHNGLFYGITYNGGRSHAGQPARYGTIFELAAPSPGSSAPEWSEQVLHTFGGTNAADGAFPQMLAGATGTDGTYALYGVTPTGGSTDQGTIFRYVP